MAFTEIYKATLPATCVVLKSVAKSALSREKTSCNGNVVLVSEKKKKKKRKERKKEGKKERNKEKLRGNIKKKWIKPRNTIRKFIIQVKRAMYFSEGTSK